MSTETKTDREMLAALIHDGVEQNCRSGDYDAADAILASDWLRERDGANYARGLVARRGMEAETWEEGLLAAGGLLVVVTRYGGHRHYAKGDRFSGLDERRHTICRGVSSWTIDSWKLAATWAAHGLTAEAMEALPMCPTCSTLTKNPYAETSAE